MPRRSASSTAGRTPGTLTRDRILDVAIAVADRDGLDALSMRRLGQELAVDPMALYRHVRDKDDLLDGIADRIVAGNVAAAADQDTGGWKAAVRTTILGARATALAHPWLPAVLEARRQPGPATLRYLDGVLGLLRAGGFSVAMGHHALHVLGSRILGFSQDLFDDGTPADPDLAALQARQLAAVFPSLGELALSATHAGGLGGCDDDAEFAFAVDLMLDGLERRMAD